MDAHQQQVVGAALAAHDGEVARATDSASGSRFASFGTHGGTVIARAR